MSERERCETGGCRQRHYVSYYYYYYYYCIAAAVSCHLPFLPSISLEPAVILTVQASSFILQYFPYYM
jgi:hypothetical protein